ncbi:MAG TPA: patatin-like phospholipase family protein [Acidimicrobiia bacterium]|nr:patatin-like phospholipase family protein [Acidimicrobiia bacterium]
MSEVPGPVAFVLGGGGRLGAAEVGMAAALVDAGIRADLIVGTSIGAINGALLAASPGLDGVERLRVLWQGVAGRGLLSERMADRVRTLRRTRVSLHSTVQLEEVLIAAVGTETRIEDLAIPFGCVAACIETASATWFDRGPLVPALLASSAVPGLFEAVVIEGRHYLDGGLVESIPVARAIEQGARTVFVLQVGRIEQPLSPPKNPAEVAQVAFEIARRHRFATVMESLPPGVTVHVLPTGATAPVAMGLRSNLRYRDLSGIPERIERAHAASRAYLSGLGPPATGPG